MRPPSKRFAFALTMATLWIGWAIWANVPHYYDAQAMKTEIAAVLGHTDVDLQPAQAGFPFAYMRYDYSNADRLTIYDTTYSALIPTVLFAIAGTLGVSLLVMRTHQVSLFGALAFCCLMVPAALMYLLLNGSHSDLISYLYLVPLVLLMLTAATNGFREQRGQNSTADAGHRTGELEIPTNGPSSVATG